MDSHTIIDPFVFAIPMERSAETCRRYLGQIQVWGSSLLGDTASYSTSENAVTALAAEGRYPEYPVVAAIIEQHRIDDFTAYDISNYLSLLAGRRPYLEERSGISCLVLGNDAIAKPAAICDRLGSAVGRALLESLFMAVLGVRLGWAVSLTIGTTEAEEHQNLSLSGTIELAEAASGEIHGGVEVEYIANITCSPPADVVDDILVLALDPIAAVRWCYDRLPASVRSNNPLGVVEVGPHFIASIERSGLHRQRALAKKLYAMAAMAAIGRLGDIPGADLHPVRVSRAADAPQVQHGDAKLWRCKVSQHGAGFRLHYWSLPGPRIVLAEVLVESKV